MNLLRLSLKLLRRDWRAGEWRVLLIALVLAVGSIATVGLFADRVRLALQQEATSLLGADLRISSSRPLPPAYREAARQRGLRVVETASFPSMAAGKQQSVLAEILAVEEGYPLRGKMVIDDGSGGVSAKLSPSPQSSPASGRGGERENKSLIPARGTLWADARLMQRLGVKLGDEVGIGALRLRLAAEVVRDVDQSVGFAIFAPRVILNSADLPASGLVQEGSRIHYRLLVAGEAKQVDDLRGWLQEYGRLGVGEKLEDVRDARPEIRTALERAEHFLGLAALTAVVLAGVALALAARHFISRHLDACARRRCIGANHAQVLRIFLYQFRLPGACAEQQELVKEDAQHLRLVRAKATHHRAGIQMARDEMPRGQRKCDARQHHGGERSQAEEMLCAFQRGAYLGTRIAHILQLLAHAQPPRFL